MLDDVVLMKDLNDQERLMFQNEVNARRKDVGVGVILCLFLGGLGAHRFYLGQAGLGAVYVLLCWTFIPALVALVECFLMPGRIRHHNAAVASEVITKLKALRA